MENYKNAKTIFKQIDSFYCNISSSCIAVDVCGEISNNDEDLRRFIQSFVLAPQNGSSKKYYVLSDTFGYEDDLINNTGFVDDLINNIGYVDDLINNIVDKVVEAEHVKKKPMEPTTAEEVNPDVSQAKSSTVEEAKKAVNEPAATVTEGKRVGKKAEVVTSPNAEEQKTEETAPVVEVLSVVRKSFVVEETPKPVIKLSAPTFIEVQKFQQKVRC